MVIPAKNEASNLARLLPEIKRRYPKLRTLVVDDGSTDETREVCAEHGATVLSMPYMFLLPVFTEEVLHVGAQSLGFLWSASGAGAVVEGFLVHRDQVLGDHADGDVGAFIEEFHRRQHQDTVVLGNEQEAVLAHAHAVCG